MSYDRTDRISEQVKKELSLLIKDELKDPRISPIITLTSVRVTKDLKYAKVFISVLGNEKEKNDTIDALKSASGFIRREIGNRVKLRCTPEFIFELDNSIENGFYISKIIDDINRNNGEKHE